MTLATTGATPETTNDSTESTPVIKTALDCDILTTVTSATTLKQSAAAKQNAVQDPLDALYKPLGNKDVACVLQANHRM